jgi:hypothetical protein
MEEIGLCQGRDAPWPPPSLTSVDSRQRSYHVNITNIFAPSNIVPGKPCNEIDTPPTEEIG